MAGTELKQSKDAPLSFFSFQDIIASVTALMVLITLVIALDPLGDEISLRKRSRAEPMSQQGRVEQARIRLESAQAAIAQARQALQERQSQPNVTADLIARLERLVAPEREGVAALEQVASAGDAELRAIDDRQIVVQAETEEAERDIARRRQADADRIMRSRVRAFEGPAEPLKPLLIELRADRIVVGTLDHSRAPVEMTVCNGTGRPAISCLGPVLAAHPRTEWYGLLVVWPQGLDQMRDLRAVHNGLGYEVGWQLWDGASGGFFERPQAEPPRPAAPAGGAQPAAGSPQATDAPARTPGPWPLVIPASVATVARVHRRGRKGGSIGTDPFGLFLDALCNTLGVVMLLLMVILIFSKAEGALEDPKVVEAQAVELEKAAVDAERDLTGVLESLSKLPPSGDPALVATWKALLAEEEQLRTRKAALQQSIDALRAQLEARKRELEELEARKRALEAESAALAAAPARIPDFIRLSRYRPDSRDPIHLAIAGGRVSAIVLAGKTEILPPTQGDPLGSDAEAEAAVTRFVGGRSTQDVRVEVAVWNDSFAEYKRFERALVERGYAINPLPVEVGKAIGVGSGQGGVQ